MRGRFAATTSQLMRITRQISGDISPVRVEIIHKSKFLPGTVEKNSSTIRSSGSGNYTEVEILTGIFWSDV